MILFFRQVFYGHTPDELVENSYTKLYMMVEEWKAQGEI